MTKPKQQTAVMQKLHVFIDSKKIGYGYLYYYSDGKLSEPELYSEDGVKLPEGWYELVITNENHLVVVPRQKQ